MSFRGFIIFCCVCSIAAPAVAQAFRSVNRLIVVPVSSDTFEVIDDKRAGAQGMWCAGADYARHAASAAFCHSAFCEFLDDSIGSRAGNGMPKIRVTMLEEP